jgi:uridine phosphorylase
VRSLAHIHQTAELAERVLLPGDPGRALRIAQELLDSPKMLNHNRGLWGYTGTAADGAPLSIQSTGIGGPSAAIVLTELIKLGARRLIRIGTCGALDPGLAPGDLLVVSDALSDDGTSRALGMHPPLTPVHGSDELLAALVAGGTPRTIVASTDLHYESAHRAHAWAQGGAQVVDLATAAVFATAARHGAEAGCALLVSHRFGSERYLEPDELHSAELELGRLAIAALS